MKSTDIEYSIILPCLNEEKTLGICIHPENPSIFFKHRINL